MLPINESQADFIGVHAAKSLGKAELGLDIEGMPQRQQAPGNGRADQLRVAPPLILGRRRILHEDSRQQCPNLLTPEKRDGAISVAIGIEMVRVPSDRAFCGQGRDAAADRSRAEGGSRGQEK